MYPTNDIPILQVRGHSTFLTTYFPNLKNRQTREIKKALKVHFSNTNLCTTAYKIEDLEQKYFNTSPNGLKMALIFS